MTLVRCDSFGVPPPPSTKVPDWCVDLGERLLTLTTFEVWTAIARGEIRGGMLAWREGLECWTPVEELSELACALSYEASSTPGPTTADLEAPDSLAALELELGEAEPAAASAEVLPPAPPPRRRAPIASSSGMRGAMGRGEAALRRTATAIAFASAAAVLFAAFRPTPAVAAAPIPAVHAGLETAAHRLEVLALQRAVAALEAGSAQPVRKPERGQRRLRAKAR